MWCDCAGTPAKHHTYHTSHTDTDGRTCWPKTHACTDARHCAHSLAQWHAAHLCTHDNRLLFSTPFFRRSVDAMRRYLSRRYLSRQYLSRRYLSRDIGEIKSLTLSTRNPFFLLQIHSMFNTIYIQLSLTKLWLRQSPPKAHLWLNKERMVSVRLGR